MQHDETVPYSDEKLDLQSLKSPSSLVMGNVIALMKSLPERFFSLDKHDHQESDENCDAANDETSNSDFASHSVKERAQMILDGVVKLPFGWTPEQITASSTETPIDAAASPVEPEMSKFDPTSLSALERARRMDSGKWGSGFDSTEEIKPTGKKSVIDLPSNSGSVAKLANKILNGEINLPGLSVVTNKPMPVETPSETSIIKETSAKLQPAKPEQLPVADLPSAEPKRFSAVDRPFSKPGRLSVKEMVGMIENGEMGAAKMRR